MVKLETTWEPSDSLTKTHPPASNRKAPTTNNGAPATAAAHGAQLDVRRCGGRGGRVVPSTLRGCLGVAAATRWIS